jgi:hypothetical protein
VNEDDGADWWQQQDLEARQQMEEEALARGRQVLAEFRRANAQYDTEMKALTERVRNLTCKA